MRVLCGAETPRRLALEPHVAPRPDQLADRQWQAVERIPIPGWTEQQYEDFVHQTAQIGAASHEIPFRADVREPAEPTVHRVAPDRRVAPQAFHLAPKLKREHLRIGQHRLGAATTAAAVSDD
jgi:hypothetical protein